MKYLLILLALAIPSTASGGTPELTDSEVQELQWLENYRASYKTGLSDGSIGVENAVLSVNILDDKIQRVAGRQLKEATGHDSPYSSEEINRLVNEKRGLAKFFTFKNIILALAGLLLVVAVVGLSVYYLKPVLFAMPLVFWEFAAWATAISALASHHFWPATDFWLVYPGAIGVIPCLLFTIGYRFDKDYEMQNVAQVLAAVCMVVWGFFAVLYQSYFLGFIAVMAFESLIGFSVLMTPLCYYIGFNDEKVIPRAMGASFVLMVGYVVTKVTEESFGMAAVFLPGMLWMGSFVYYIGCLIVSSKHYYTGWWREMPTEAWHKYLFANVLTIVSGLAAFYLGTALGVPVLLGIGGTFFTLFLLEKYLELPWKKVGWSWAMLILAVVLYYFAGYVTTHREYFLF